MTDPPARRVERLDDVARLHVPDVRALVSAGDDPRAVAVERQAVGDGVRQVVGQGPVTAGPQVQHRDGHVRVAVARAHEGDGDALAVRGDPEPPADRVAAQYPPASRVPDERLALRGGSDQRAVRGEADVDLVLVFAHARVRALPDRPPAAAVEQRQSLLHGQGARVVEDRQRDGEVAAVGRVREQERLGVDGRDRPGPGSDAAGAPGGDVDEVHAPCGCRCRGPTATVRPSGANCIACSITGRSRRTDGPDGFHVRRSVKRTTPSRSPDASSRPSGLIASAATLDRRQLAACGAAAGLRCSAASRSRASATRSSSSTRGDAVEHRLLERPARSARARRRARRPTVSACASAARVCAG